jgi:hypothetical protein
VNGDGCLSLSILGNRTLDSEVNKPPVMALSYSHLKELRSYVNQNPRLNTAPKKTALAADNISTLMTTGSRATEGSLCTKATAMT